MTYLLAALDAHPDGMVLLSIAVAVLFFISICRQIEALGGGKKR